MRLQKPELHLPSSGCRDLNPGPLDPQSSALTKLRHSPLLQSQVRGHVFGHQPFAFSVE